jgi:hypothetical protein
MTTRWDSAAAERNLLLALQRAATLHCLPTPPFAGLPCSSRGAWFCTRALWVGGGVVTFLLLSSVLDVAVCVCVWICRQCTEERVQLQVT